MHSNSYYLLRPSPSSLDCWPPLSIQWPPDLGAWSGLLLWRHQFTHTWIAFSRLPPGALSTHPTTTVASRQLVSPLGISQLSSFRERLLPRSLCSPPRSGCLLPSCSLLAAYWVFFFRARWTPLDLPGSPLPTRPIPGLKPGPTLGN